jgi:hypothetical protein
VIVVVELTLHVMVGAPVWFHCMFYSGGAAALHQHPDRMSPSDSQVTRMTSHDCVCMMHSA